VPALPESAILLTVTSLSCLGNAGVLARAPRVGCKDTAFWVESSNDGPFFLSPAPKKCESHRDGAFFPKIFLFVRKIVVSLHGRLLWPDSKT